jgi:phosphotransferase family enzyme
MVPASAESISGGGPPAGVQPPAPCHTVDAWLPAVAPASARTLRIDAGFFDTSFNEAVAEAMDADVEIVADAARAGGAPTVVVVCERAPHEDRRRTRRLLRRAAGSVALRGQARRARRALTRSGYETIDTVAWEPGRLLQLKPGRTRWQLTDLLPQHVLVVARRHGAERTMLDDAVAAAGATAELEPLTLSLRACVLVATSDDRVLRVTSGPARRLLARHRSALGTLRNSPADDLDVRLLPQPLAHGEAGIASWYLESRLPGSKGAPRLAKALVEECIAFLAALHLSGGASDGPESWLTRLSMSMSPLLGSARSELLGTIARRIETECAGFPRGFAHGDFFHGNLLVDDFHLVGVVDWDAAGHGRLPAIDLLHLVHLADNRPDDLDWGPLLLSRLLPWARAGGGDLIPDYMARLGISATPTELEALVGAYWLQRLAYQLTTYGDRAQRSQWLDRNVDLVAHALLQRSAQWSAPS